MIKYLSLLSLFFFHITYAERPVGYLWYNLPSINQHVKAPKGVPFHQLSYTDKDRVLHFYTMEALHKVRFTHRLEDEKNFLALQEYWIKEAKIHGLLNQKALLFYPQYDLSIEHPSSMIGAQIHDDLMNKKKKRALNHLAKTHGLLFYYRGAHPLDRRQIPILKDFCKRYGFHMVGVSVDGVKALEGSRVSKSVNVSYFPALFLVQPKKREVIPMAYGLTTEDVLVEHLWAFYQKEEGYA